VGKHELSVSATKTAAVDGVQRIVGHVKGRGRPRFVGGIVLAGYLFSVTGAALFHTHGGPAELGLANAGGCNPHCGDAVRGARAEADWALGLLAVHKTAPSISFHGPCAVCQFLSQKVLPVQLAAAAACQTLQTLAAPVILPACIAGPVRTHHSRAPPSLA